MKEWLKERPCISLRCLEREKLNYQNGRRKLSAEHIEKLMPLLSKYGFKQQ